MPDGRLKFKLQEKSSEYPQQRLKGVVVANEDWLEIYVEGFGENGADDGEGSIVQVELYEGELRVLLRPYINVADPLTILMGNAKESLRGSSSELRPDVCTFDDPYPSG